MQSTRYGYFRRLVHWAAALSVLGLLCAGLLFSFYTFDELQAQFGADNTAMLYKYHKSFGLLTLVLALLIYWMRRHSGVPAYDPPQSFLVRWPAKLVAWLMILAMIVMPILGWLATTLSGFPVPFFEGTIPNFLPEDKEIGKQLFGYHAQLGWILMTLVGIHLLGVIVHKIVCCDKVTKRMSLFSF